ncbi:amino acid transporter [Eremomyces bilateralis CBS 781.70]|uniref:Amino acid transporter n=1 Tax=Eremomyces bilateralis CBS 781.70 TaxID=1392243 RepID=A0A6G1G4K9_9PEZI|nr:amino acid transporter [Eremomyces bilateralis CBS 781.70]KAF1812932.1 amino acid transporter [Eremomyces bilateralis CBS 781.70]
MESEKEVIPVVTAVDSEVVDNPNLPTVKKGTKDDQRDMFRMGKVQEMRRNFQLITIFGFSMILMATWEVALGVSTLGLMNGGTAGMVWMFFIVWWGFIAINTSMAEMASMAPTSGGQYHWVSEFAPRQHQKFLSYMIGWLCVLAWQASSAATAFIAGSQIQGLVILNYPNYTPENWHGTLMVFAVSAFAVLFNTVLAKKLPLIEGTILVIHILGFFAILIPLWVLGPRGDPKVVFSDFQAFTGWSPAAGTLVGVLPAILPLLGADACVHMSEELRDASASLPKSMIWTTVSNGALGFIMLATFAMTLGDIETVINSPTKNAFIEVFFNVTKSYKATNAMSSLIIFMQIFCNLSIVATASRQLFAFARDGGVPFASYFAYIPQGWDIPVNSVILSFVSTCLLSLINLGSPVAFNSISSISTGALLSSYAVSIGLIAFKRIRGEPLLPSKFTLGKFGLPLNIISILFLLFLFLMSFFPSFPSPDAETFNWGVLVYVVIVLFSLVYYYWRGRHVYVGPVEYVRKIE